MQLKEQDEGFKKFMGEYNKAEVPQHSNVINSSKFTLKQQLKRFINFSHSENEIETMRKEAL